MFCPKCGSTLKEEPTAGANGADAKFSQAVFKAMANTGKSYDECTELVSNAEPQLLKAWLDQGAAIHARFQG